MAIGIVRTLPQKIWPFPNSNFSPDRRGRPRWRASATHIKQPRLPCHDPLHDSQQLLGHELSMIFGWAMPSKTVLSSLPMWVAPLVRVSRLAPVAGKVRSRPWPSLSQPFGSGNVLQSSLMIHRNSARTFRSKEGEKVLTQRCRPSRRRPHRSASCSLRPPTLMADSAHSGEAPPPGRWWRQGPHPADTTRGSCANTFMAAV